MPSGVIRLGLALALGGLLSGLLSLGMGRLLSPEPADSNRRAIECFSLPARDPRPSMSVVRLSTSAASGASLNLQFLNADGTIMRTQHLKLIAGAQTSFSVPAREMGSALRVLAEDEVDVQVTQLSSGEGGPAEARSVPCICRA